MQFFIRKRRQAPAVIIVALIDILIVLLIFLMVTTTFKQQPALKLALPESTQAKKSGATETPPLIVSIDPKGTLRLGADTNALSIARIKAEILSAVARKPDLQLAISADKDAPIGQVIKVMDVSKEANLKSAVNLFTKQPGKALSRREFGLGSQLWTSPLVALQPEGRFMLELQQVLVGGDRRFVGEQHDNGGEPVAAPLPLAHQPLLDEVGDRLAAGLADELEVGGVPGPLLQGGGHAPLQRVELVVLVEARPAALGAPLHFVGVNGGREGGADAAAPARCKPGRGRPAARDRRAAGGSGRKPARESRRRWSPGTPSPSPPISRRCA